MPYFIVAIVLSIGARSWVMAQVVIGPNVNVSDIPGPQSEVGVAVNPTNPLNIVAVANEIVDLTKLGVWYSLDGGATWTANFVDENEDGFGANDVRFDPNAAFDSDGNVYVVYSTRGTGNRVALVRSSDGGQNYDQVTTVTTDGGVSNLHTSMVTTRSAAGADAVLVVYARVQGLESIEAALSLDAGASFPIHNHNINDVLQRTFVPWAVADAAGDFHVVWEVNEGGGTGIILHDVLNGVTLADGANTTVTTIEITDFFEPTSKIPAQPDRGIFSVATVDVDRVSGRVYLSYTDRLNTATDDTDIYVRFSDNNGADWSARIQINDDATTTSQFMPRMVVDQTTGVVVAIWYDARDDVVNNGLVDIFTSVSHDGAVSWSRNQRVTTAPSDESVNNPLRYFGNYLEYIGLTVHAGVAHVSWTDARDDNFNSGTKEDVYSAVIFLNGICPWDLDGNGSVGAADLLALLVSWGPCKGCPADFDDNGTVGASDLLALLVNWGPCP
ncbi:MAG: sialidase family protein [Phycisphaerales bacterium]